MQQQQQDKRTASQKIEDLEQGLMSIYQTADNMARDLMTIKEAIKLLGNKLDAVVKATVSGEQLNDETLAKIMVQNNVDDLKQKVTDLVAQGILAPATEVGVNSFIVGKEVDSDGTVQNPRLQFVVSALQEPIKSKFPGAKPGDLLELQEGKLKFQVDEVYDLQTPKSEQSVTEEATLENVTPATETAPETPQA